MSLTEEDMNKLCDMYDHMSSEQNDKFLRKFGLIYCSGLDPFSKINEGDNDDIIELSSNIDDKVSLDIIKDIEKKLENGKTIITIRAEDLSDGNRYVSSYNSVYTILDEQSYGGFLVLAKKGQEDRQIKLAKQRINEGLDNSMISSVVYVLSKHMIPKLLEKFRNETDTTPADISLDKWKEILSEIIWYVNECMNDFDGYPTNSNEKEINDYNNKFNKSKQLLAQYFADLWI